MRKFQIYPITNQHEYWGNHDSIQIDTIPVAIVEAEDLDDAWVMTQHDTYQDNKNGWVGTYRPGVQLPITSTKVGDVFVEVRENGEKYPYVVEPRGFSAYRGQRKNWY